MPKAKRKNPSSALRGPAAQHGDRNATRVTAGGTSEEPFWLSWILRALFVVCAGLALRGLAGGWDKPLQDLHGFRQTQTALGVRSMIELGTWLRYETPVFGPPWSIPFELPLYQWAVALVTIFSGIPLAQSGRWVSAAFFVAAVALGYRVLGQLAIRSDHRLAVLSLLLASPLYLFWSRTFLIESTALFLSLAYLALVLRAFERPSPAVLIGAACVGALAATVKVTTFWGFLFIAGLLALRRLRALRSQRGEWQFVRETPFQVATAALAISLVVVPAAALLVWTRFTDGLKLANPLAAGFVDSASLFFWNFGDGAQRVSARLWDKTITGTQVTEVLGSRIFLPLIVVAACTAPARRAMIWALLGAFVLGPLTFTNLHIVHNYYAYANGIFLLAAAGLVLVAWMERGGAASFAAVVALLVVVMIQQLEYESPNGYRERQLNTPARIPTLYEKMRDLVPKDKVILVYGLDWEPSVSYYSERRVIMDRANRALDQPPISESLRLLKEAGQTVGAMVNCDLVWNAPGPYHPPDLEGVIATFGLSAIPAFEDSHCKLYVAE